MTARSAFFGTPAAAIPALAALAAGTSVELVVTQPDRPQGRSKQLIPSAVKIAASEWGIPIAQPSRAVEIAGNLEGLDVAVVVAYGQILPERMLGLPRHGFINVHFSKLPRWRGAAPVARAILAGDDSTGVDLMQLDAGMDTGPIIARSNTPIGPSETGGTLTARLAGLGAALLARTLPGILDGSAERVAQPENGVSLAPKVSSAEAFVSPLSTPAAQIDRAVRAFNPSPGAWAIVDGERLKVWRSGVRSGTDLAPGATEFVDGAPVVGTPDGAWELIEVQAAGKARLDAAGWARGHRGEYRWE